MHQLRKRIDETKSKAKIRVNFTIQPGNYEEAPNFPKWARENGAHHVTFHNLSGKLATEESNAVYNAVCQQLGSEVNHEVMHVNNNCGFRNLIMQSNLDVLDADAGVVIGNLKFQSIDQILSNERFSQN